MKTPETVRWLETFDQLTGSALFEIDFVANPVAPGEYDQRDGLGDFDDLRRLLRAAVAR